MLEGGPVPSPEILAAFEREKQKISVEKMTDYFNERHKKLVQEFEEKSRRIREIEAFLGSTMSHLDDEEGEERVALK